jgi:hypothetical protein
MIHSSYVILSGAKRNEESASGGGKRNWILHFVQDDVYKLRYEESTFALADGFGRKKEVQSLWGG